MTMVRKYRGTISNAYALVVELWLAYVLQYPNVSLHSRSRPLHEASLQCFCVQ